MVQSMKNNDGDETMPQTVPSAGFTPPCDYSTFADSFDLSLLPGEEDSPPYLSPSTPLYTYSPPPATCGNKPKIYTTFYSNLSDENVEKNDIDDLGPDFQKLLTPDSSKKGDNNYLTSPPTSGIFLEVPNSTHTFSTGSLSPYQTLLSPNGFSSPLSDNQTLYPNSPELSLYPHSPSFYPQSPENHIIKKEIYYSTSPIPYIKEEIQNNSCLISSQTNSNDSNRNNRNNDQSIYNILDTSPLGKQIKQESTVDFGNLLHEFQSNDSIFYKSFEKSEVKASEKAKDHQLLREALRDTSFQRRYNIKTFDFPLHEDEIKMEESVSNDISCGEGLPREKIDPVLTIAIEHMKKDIDNTCKTLGIPKDPNQWSSDHVFSWLKCTTNQFNLPPPISDQWNLNGNELITLTEEDFSSRISQGGSILHAQLEIWKASYSENDLEIPWLLLENNSNATPSTSTNTSTTITTSTTTTTITTTTTGDISDEEEDESSPMEVETKPSTSRGSGSSHIHLWQFLKELLASPQLHGSCIRWIDRSKGVFKIEDSVKVAKLWGKRKNRPAMNYDKLSRSIRQYYKKGIMKKTERSQRLVYQFCHPYNL